MVLKRTGLLSNCEQMLTPMSSDKEGHLLGGFGGIVSATSLPTSNSACQNVGCQNASCANGDCSNQQCSNSGCISVDITTAVPTTTPHMPGVHLCGLL